MTNLMDSIKLYKRGKIDIETLVEKFSSVADIVSKEVEGGGVNAYSFRQSFIDEIRYIEDAAGEENMLRFDALLCDIANNLAHSLKAKNKVKRTEKAEKLEAEMMGVKKGMAIEIIRECQKLGNRAYGIKEGGFFVDIPMCGQIGWHFPGHCGLVAKEYEFPIEQKSVEYPNKKFLCEGLKRSEISTVSERTRKVMECQDVEELCEVLYGLPDMRKTLVSQINQPSAEDLKLDEALKGKTRSKEKTTPDIIE